MNEQPQPTRFQLVPAMPVVVLSQSKDECRLLIAGEVSAGNTLRAAIEAAIGGKQ